MSRWLPLLRTKKIKLTDKRPVTDIAFQVSNNIVKKSNKAIQESVAKTVGD